MMSKKAIRIATVSILLAITFLAITYGNSFATASSLPDQNAQAKFERLALDVARMDRFYSGGNGIKVTFDAKSASKAGFSKESITLAQEMANFTNDLVKASPRGGKSLQASDVNMEISKSYVQSTYPQLNAFYEATNIFVSEVQAEVDSGNINPEFGDNILTYYYCGWYTWPRPSRGAPYNYYTNSNPAAVLKSWGYHQTPSGGPGGGWTRDQTYWWQLCGFNTYRDHANIDSKVKTKFWEQTYKGFTPRGEPNPELWRVGPWPYATWPAYAYWWHATH